MRRGETSTAASNGGSAGGRFDVSSEILRLIERVAWLEATAQHGTEMVRMALKRTDQAHTRIDHNERRLDRHATDISSMNTALRERETGAQHRHETAILALKGVGIVITLITLIGVLLGKLPAEALKWAASGGVSVK